jgi:dTDP-4-amino-4,6-dideoxygalactose transaminase
MYEIGNPEVEAVRRVIEARQLFRYGNRETGHLNEVVQFEQEWGRFVGASHTVCVTSGTAALVCALAGLGIGPGDEVIIPGYTYIATALAVVNVGAIPVIVDVDESCTIDLEAIRRNLSSHTKAIIPVHMQGMPCNLEPILALAKQRGIAVVEDACQADGGSYRGKHLGTWGDAGAFSFNYFKIITSGEGGAMVTDSKEVYDRAFMQHDGGCSMWPEGKEYASLVFCGGSFRSNEISAAILRSQLTRLPGIVERLRRVKRAFSEGIRRTDAVRLARNYDLDGDCGVQTLLHTDSEERTRALIDALKPDVPAVTPIDSGRHVYSNWDPIMGKRGASHPAMDPFAMPANDGLRMDYRPDMLPRTTELLARSVMIPSNVAWTEEETKAKLQTINRAVEQVSAVRVGT